ncbi:unnamed protein product [uncultured bacterium]|nr:unnamed protein product [uncultured bacterium]
MRVPLWIGWHALHANPAYSTIDRALAWMSPPMALFGSAVMLFFVVSGFAIHYPHAVSDGGVALGPYGLRRFLRIYPPYAIAVLFTVAVEHAVTAMSGAAPSPAAKVAASLAMAQNYIPPAGQLSANPSLWSLPVEVELYLVYPALLLLWRRFGMTAAVAVTAAVSLTATIAAVLGRPWPLLNFAAYWIIWVSGAVLAELFRNSRLPRWTASKGWMLAAMLAIAIAVRVSAAAPGVEHLLWGGSYFLLVWCVLQHPGWTLSRLPSMAAALLRRLGELSYSLYLVHYPVLLLIGACWISVFGRKPSNLLIPVAGAIATTPVAYLLWRFVERPSHALARTLAARSNVRPRTD